MMVFSGELWCVMSSVDPLHHLQFIPLPVGCQPLRGRGGIFEEVASHSCHGPAKLLEERHVVSAH